MARPFDSTKKSYLYCMDPMQFKQTLWPDVRFYDKQKEIIYSIANDDKTFVPAGNMLGKDFVAAFICLWFFLTRKPCRIVTTSAKDDHLRVLWGEISRFIETARCPLKVENGGPLLVRHQQIRKVLNDGLQPIDYLIGMVASQDTIAAMQGHHANPTDLRRANDGLPRTLFVVDEASSVPQDYFEKAETWAKRMLVIGNTWPCNNEFKWASEGKPGTDDIGGDIPRVSGIGYHRRVIRIEAEDSPNVQLARTEMAAGKEPSGRVVVPGVKTWDEYQKNLRLMDPATQTVVLRAQFHKGRDALMYPPEWLLRAVQFADQIRFRPRQAKAIGIDPGEGGDDTAMTAGDELGVIETVSAKTPDTNDVYKHAVEFAKKHKVPWNKVLFDRGGGGKQHADRMVADGMPVRSVGFGESVKLPPQKAQHRFADKVDTAEEGYVYLNLRAKMYHALRLKLDPSLNPTGFAIGREWTEIHRQLAPIPMLWDREGRIRMLPKNRVNKSSNEQTLTDLLGCSPDEADSLVLMIHAMDEPDYRPVITGG